MPSVEKSELLKIIGKRIQEIRLSKGYSQVDLAGKMEGEFDTTNVSRVEIGKTNSTIYTLHRIAEALEVSLSELLDIEDNKD